MFSADEICTMIKHVTGGKQSFVVIVQRDTEPVSAELEDVKFEIAGYGEDGEMDAMLAVASASAFRGPPDATQKN